MSSNVNHDPTIVGEAIIVTVFVKENYITVSTLHSGCCRLPYQYLMDKSYMDKSSLNSKGYHDKDFYKSKEIRYVHFIDCINLSTVKQNCTGTMCVFRLLSKERNCFTDWNLGVILYFLHNGITVYKFDDLSCFGEMDCDLIIENYLSSKKVFTIKQLLDNEVEILYINQVSGNKLLNNGSPREQFKLVWDKVSSFIQCSPEGPDTLPFSKFINQNKRMRKDWEETRVPASIQMNKLLATKKRKRKPTHPFEYHLTCERQRLERYHCGCYYNESTCFHIPKNNFYAVPFTDSSKSMDQEVVLSYLPSEAMKRLIQCKHKKERDHNEYLYENGCWFETVPVHHPDMAPGGITYSKVNRDQHGTTLLAKGEYSEQFGVVVSHWIQRKSQSFYNIDFNLFVKIKDNIYKSYSFERNIFSKIGCNIYSGKFILGIVNCHF